MGPARFRHCLLGLVISCASPERENARLLEHAQRRLDAGQPHLAQLLLDKVSTSTAQSELLSARAKAAEHDVGGTITALETAAELGLRDAAVLDDPDFALVRGDFGLERLRAVLSLPDGGALPHGTGLVRSTPEAEGLNADAVTEMLAEAERTRTAALVVLRHGKLVGEWTFGHAPMPTLALLLPTHHFDNLMGLAGHAQFLDVAQSAFEAEVPAWGSVLVLLTWVALVLVPAFVVFERRDVAGAPG